MAIESLLKNMMKGPTPSLAHQGWKLRSLYAWTDRKYSTQARLAWDAVWNINSLSTVQAFLLALISYGFKAWKNYRYNPNFLFVKESSDRIFGFDLVLDIEHSWLNVLLWTL